MSSIKEFQDKDFNDFVKAKKSGLVIFSASWCGACKIVAPIITKIAQNYPKLDFIKIDVSNSPELASKMGVMSIPNMIFFNKGKVVEQIIGAASEKDIEARIKKITK